MKKIKCINVCNPVDVKKEYLLFAVEYAKENGFDSIQINGPIHNYIKGNIDGMTLYKKYSEFNNEKDIEYVNQAMDAVNAACEKADEYGIKMYLWHHELELPVDFCDYYPETLNEYGDIEVSHPLVKDFIENKIKDFFDSYPKMNGIILTLHETRIPLLKLKNQKLDKVERVKYITKILYDVITSLGKELIVRPFASIEEDYEMMAKAYEEISSDMVIMDKWTQFDWSLTLPHNVFFNKIKNNPLFVEGDIFGEFFGKGKLPLMLKKHLADKFEYCEKFNPIGYVLRIDREECDLFGDVNEVNIAISKAHLDGLDVEKVIDDFFILKYGEHGNDIKALMEETESIQTDMFYLDGYYFNDQSLFPRLNHAKNHYHFEIMRDSCDIASNEWYIPRDWKRCSIEKLQAQKKSASDRAQKLFDKLTKLENKIDADEYGKLYVKFANLKYAAKLWQMLMELMHRYVKYFETKEEKYESQFYHQIDELLVLRDAGVEMLGNDFCGLARKNFFEAHVDDEYEDRVQMFAEEISESFKLEKKKTAEIEGMDNVVDYVICGGATEGHRLQKEVNFSDTLIRNSGVCRIAGNQKGTQWSAIKAHGWFSYDVKTVPGNNIIKMLMGSDSTDIAASITIGDERHIIHEAVKGTKEFCFVHKAKQEGSVRVRVDKISDTLPQVFSIIVCK